MWTQKRCHTLQNTYLEKNTWLHVILNHMLGMFFFQFLYHHLVVWSTCSSFCSCVECTKINCQTLWYFPLEKRFRRFVRSVWYLIVHTIPFLCLFVLFWNILHLLVWLVLWLFFSTLVIGGAGSLMLDLYGWESVFYVSGVLSVLWAYCMWKYLLKGEGKWGDCVCESDYQTGKTSLDPTVSREYYHCAQ